MPQDHSCHKKLPTKGIKFLITGPILSLKT
jgi:hypothetical protein